MEQQLEHIKHQTVSAIGKQRGMKYPKRQESLLAVMRRRNWWLHEGVVGRSRDYFRDGNADWLCMLCGNCRSRWVSSAVPLSLPRPISSQALAAPDYTPSTSNIARGVGGGLAILIVATCHVLYRRRRRRGQPGLDESEGRLLTKPCELSGYSKPQELEASDDLLPQVAELHG